MTKGLDLLVFFFLCFTLYTEGATHNITWNEGTNGPISITTTIEVGDIVTWVTTDDRSHLIQADTLADLVSPQMRGTTDNPSSYSYTFGVVGTYSYKDTKDNKLSGTVIVQAASTSPPTSGPSGTSAPYVPVTKTVTWSTSSSSVSTSVYVGDTVTWNVGDKAPHTVTSTDASGELDSSQFGASWSHTFMKVGSFPYKCLIHKSMTGSVTVTAVPNTIPTGDPTQPTPAPTSSAPTTPLPTPSPNSSPSDAVGCVAGEKYTGNVSMAWGGWLEWVIDCDHETIFVNLACPTQGWVAVGWNNKQAMPGADIAFAWINDGGNPFIVDATNGEYVPPKPDATNNLQNASIEFNGTHTILQFQKLLNTGDDADIAISTATPLYLLVAMATVDPTGDDISKASQHLASNGADTYYIDKARFFPIRPNKTGIEGCPIGSLFRGSYDNPGATWSLAWVIDCTQGTFTGTIKASTTGWVAFGLNTYDAMPGADVLQASCDESGKVTFVDAHTVSYSQPVPDSVNNLQNVSCTEKDGVTTIVFTRSLETGDDNDLPIKPGFTHMLWAYSQGSDSFSSQHTNKAVLSVDFYTGKTSSKVDLYLVHGILMIVAWALLSPIGTFIARYLKGLGHLWFQLHVSLQVFSVVFTVIALIVVEKGLYNGQHPHFQHPHNFIGIIIIVLMFVQMFGGYLADKMWSPDRKGTPIFPDKLHWYGGRAIFILTVINIFLGFYQYGFTQTKIGTYITYGVWVGIMVILFTFTHFYTQRTTRDHGVPLDESSDTKGSEKTSQHPPEKPTIQLAVLAVYVVLALVLFGVLCGLFFTNLGAKA